MALSFDTDGLYSRMLLIPGWVQEFVSNLVLGLVGVGGLGAAALEALLMLGFGENARIVLVDDDFMEISNLSRISYATFQDKNRPKVKVGRDFVKRARPHFRVRAVRRPCYSLRAQRALAGCDVIVGCVDNELARYALNFLAASFMVPLLDLGAGVIIDEFDGEKVAVSSGQARLFVPGTTPCLFCNMGLDYTDFDREVLKLTMDDEERKLLKRTGYLNNFTEDSVPEPSMYTLNAVVANLGVSFLCQYLLGGMDYHALVYSMEAMNIEKLRAKSQGVCPVCGEHSQIGCAEFFDIDSLVKQKEGLPATAKEGA